MSLTSMIQGKNSQLPMFVELIQKSRRKETEISNSASLLQ